MPRATGTAETCKKKLSGLEKETGNALDQFIETAESARDFYASMEKIESSIASAQKLQAAESDLELNEAVVIADRLGDELLTAEKLAQGAALSKSQDNWAAEFEKLRNSLFRMESQVERMKGGSVLDTRNLAICFRKDAKACEKRVLSLKKVLSSKRNFAHARVRLAKRRVAKLKASVGKVFSKITKKRLKKKIARAKDEISSFMKNGRSGRIFIDHKHLTLSSKETVSRIPMTQAVFFALEEMAPVEKSLPKLGRKGTCIVGRFEQKNKGIDVKVGERSIAGDSIIYRQVPVAGK